MTRIAAIVLQRRIVPGLIALAGFVTLYLAAAKLAGDAGCFGLTDDQVRNMAHFSVYGSLSLLLAMWLDWYLLAWFVSVLLATGEEIHQLVVPWRFSCVQDWALNVTGITFFLVAGKLIVPKVRARLHARHQMAR